MKGLAGPAGFEPASSAPKAKRMSELPHGPEVVIVLAYNRLFMGPPDAHRPVPMTDHPDDDVGEEGFMDPTNAHP